MSTFKKLFATVASAMVIVSTLPAAVLGQASYGAELEGAYAYAYSMEVTTMGSIDAARMYDGLTRAELAKMMSNWAQAMDDELQADASADCSFSDLAPIAGSDLEAYAVLSCQLGLMGVGTNGIFNPTGVVDRATFGTVLSRVIRGDKYDGGNPWYANHLSALNAAGVMTNISNPQAPEIRGYAMLMMQRADEDGVADGSAGSSCDDGLVQLSCLLDLPDCPAECQLDDGDDEDDDDGEFQDEPKVGNVSLSLGANTPANGSSIPSVGTVPFAEVQFTAGSNDINVHSVTVERFGLGTRSDIDRVYFERNGIRVSSRSSLSSDNRATISFSPAIVVKANGSESLDLVASLNGAVGSEHGFRVIAMNSSAASASYNIQTPVLRTSSYTVGDIEFDNQGSNLTVKAGEEDVELGQFRLTNMSTENKEVRVKALQLRQFGDADMRNVSNLVVYRDGDIVSTDVAINGKDVSIALDTVLTDGQSALFYVRGMIDYVDNAGETYQFELRNIEDLVGEEMNTRFRTTVSFPNSLAVDGLLAEYTAEGADVMLSRDVSVPTNLQVSPGSNNVVLLKGTIKATEAILLEDLQLAINSITSTSPSNNLGAMVNRFTLRIGNTTSTWSPASTTAATQTAEFDGAFTINGTVPVELTADVRSNAPDGSFNISTINLTDFGIYEYVSSQNQVAAASIAGSIAGPLVTVTSARLNAARVDGLSSRNVVAGLDDVVLGTARFSTSDAGSIRLSSVQLQGIAANTQNQLSVTMYINGTSVSTRNANGSTITFSSLPTSLSTVSAGNPLDIEFRGDFTQSASGSNSFAIGAIQATDNNGQTVTASPTSVNFATITMSAGGSVEFTSNSNTPGASLLPGGTQSVEVAKFSVNATDDNLRLTDLYVTRSGSIDLGQRLSNIELLDGADSIAVGSVVNNGETIAFENMNGSDVIVEAGSSKVLTLRATVNGVLNSTDVAGAAGLLQLEIGDGGFGGVTAGTANGARFISQANGSVVTPATSGLTISNEHKIVRGKASVAAAATTASNTRVLNFNVTADGNRVKLQNVAFTIRNIDSTATVRLYKDSVSSSNLLASTVVTGAASANTTGGVLALGALAQEIAAGTTANYIVEIVGYVPSTAGSNFLSRQFELNDVHYQDVFNDMDVLVTGLNDFVNAGNFDIQAPSFNPQN